MRILLVEDDRMIGEEVLAALRGQHYAADWVRDGEMAQGALAAESYDLVLLDLGLPKRLRTNASSPPATCRLLAQRGAGDQVRLQVWREGKEVQVTARLAGSAERTAAAPAAWWSKRPAGRPPVPACRRAT